MLGIQLYEIDVGQTNRILSVRGNYLFVPTLSEIDQMWGIIIFAQHQRHLWGELVSFLSLKCTTLVQKWQLHLLF